MKKLLSLLLLLSLFSFAGCEIAEDDSSGSSSSNGSTGTTEATGSYEDNGFDDQISMDFANAMLKEVNYARTDPSGYAKERLQSYENAGTDNEAYDQFTDGTFPVVGSLTLNTLLNKAADKRAKYMADNNIFEHGDVKGRIEAEGYNWKTYGENIAAGSYSTLNASTDAEVAAKEFVIMWIIDDGYPPDNAGHRINLMKSSFEEIGIGYHYNASSNYGNYSVQNFGTQQ